MKKLALLAFSFLFVFTNVTAQVNTEKIDRILSKLTPDGGPGGILAVVKNGEVVFKKGYGFANVTEEKPITEETVFQIGSVSKQMTAVGILILEEDGKLSVDDPVSEYFPDYNEKIDEITIHHLLTHSSGLKNFTSLPEWNPAWSSTRSLEETIELVKGKELDYEPGSKFQYCNTGYAMLALIIEQVSGKSFDEFMKQRVFFPIGMENTRHGESNEYTGPRARGYSLDAENDLTLKEAIYTEFPQLAGAGSIVTTINDMLIWDEAVREEKLISGESWYRALSPQMPIDPDAGVAYGYGWFVGDEKDFYEKNFIRHTGGMPGFTSGYFRYADNDLSVIWLGNTDFLDSANFITNAAKTVLELDELKDIKEFSQDEIAKYEGTYENPFFDLKVEAEDGYLSVTIPNVEIGPYEYVPTSEISFTEKDITTYTITFVNDEEGIPYEADVNFYNQKMKYKKKGAKSPDAYEISQTVLQEYTGSYKFAPGQIMEISLVEGALKANLPGQPEYTLEPAGKDEFNLMGLQGFKFVFKRNTEGGIAGVTSNQPNGSFYAPKE